MKFKKICKSPNCNELISEGAYCTKHKPPNRPISEWASMYGRRWRKARYLFLLEHTDCEECGDSANEVDHIIPHRGNNELFWDKTNWQTLCKSCHSKKTTDEIKDRKNNKE